MKAKNKQISKIKKPEKLPIWNLSDLYKSVRSRELNNDLNLIKTKTKQFEKKYINKVNNLNSKQLYHSITQLEKIDMIMDKILSYAHLLVAEDGNNEKNKIFYQQMQEIITKHASSILFFNIELNNVTLNVSLNFEIFSALSSLTLISFSSSSSIFFNAFNTVFDNGLAGS